MIFIGDGFKFNPGIILIPKTFKIMLIPNIIKTIAPAFIKLILEIKMRNNMRNSIKIMRKISIRDNCMGMHYK